MYTGRADKRKEIMETEKKKMNLDYSDLDKRLISVVPSKRQIKLQQMEFYAFFHFSINTFTGREWGDGNENPDIFNPTEMDADQWVNAVKAAGMRGAILTCKHHDGFCLWPSRYTNHSIKNSPYKNGKGDIVLEVAEACKRADIKFGVYLSPWDRNSKVYGQGKAYDDYFAAQLEELLTGYGNIFCVWLDGACGEGQNGRKQIYDWKRYYDIIRKYQPGSCINVCGPDIRWCGNEAGETRKSEWSVVPADLSMAERVQEASQHKDDPAFRERKIDSTKKDLGSRENLAGEEKLIWYPAEVDISIRPGWFYHREEDLKVRSLDSLLEIYYRSVGGNCTLLLNVPAMPNGRLASQDEKRLKELGECLRQAFSHNLLDKAELNAASHEGENDISKVREDSYEGFYQAALGDRTSQLNIKWDKEQKISFLVLKENIYLSQRVERYVIWNDKSEKIYEGTVIGYKRIIPFTPFRSKEIKIEIIDSRGEPALSFIGVY